MVDNWRLTQFGEVVDLLAGFPFKSDFYTEHDNSIPLVRGDNVVQGRFRWENVKRWPLDAVNGLEEYLLQTGDVVLAMDRPWIDAGLKFACVSEYDLPCLLVQRVARLRARVNLDQGFLRHIIGGREFTEHILAIQTGTAVPHISGKQIKEFQFILPPLHEQRAIAHILGSLDDKIELNRRMNETLEGTARAVFKSWFVDFDPVHYKARGEQPPGMDAETAALFPDSFEESELGIIPSGWGSRPLLESAEYINGAAYKDMDFSPNNEGLPIVKIAELKSGITGQTRFTQKVLNEKFNIDSGDILFSWSGNPETSIETFIWTLGPAWLNQHIFKVIPTSQIEKPFVYFLLRYLKPLFTQIAGNKQTTGLGHVTRRDMQEILTVLPPQPVFEMFSRVVTPMWDQIFENELQSRTLAETRDALLPKLVSGELRVGDVEESYI